MSSLQQDDRPCRSLTNTEPLWLRGKTNFRWNCEEAQKKILNSFATGETLTQNPDLRYLHTSEDVSL